MEIRYHLPEGIEEEVIAFIEDEVHLRVLGIYCARERMMMDPFDCDVGVKGVRIFDGIIVVF